MNESPLASVNPDALTALFEADPLTVTDAQLATLVTELRRRRNEFLAQEAVKALAPKSKRAVASTPGAPAAAALDRPPTEVNLDDL